MSLSLDSISSQACIASDRNSAEWDKNWHIAALFIIIATSALGVFMPIISRTSGSLGVLTIPLHLIQFGQFFGAGIIVSTALIHVLPSAHSSLTSACLGDISEKYGAWAMLLAMSAILGMHTLEWWMTSAWAVAHSPQPLPPSPSAQSTASSDTQLFPAYSRALNASRLILPAPALSPPITPFVFASTSITPSFVVGAAASTFTSRSGFAVSRHANYAALVQSRQHLALLQHEPHFLTYAPAKSTPELLRRAARSSRTSTASSRRQLGSSNAVSLRPGSFTGGRAARERRRDRCQSMPRIPPTTLEAAIKESLLEPLPPIPAHVVAQHVKRHSAGPAVARATSCTSARVRESFAPSSRLDPVPEADDWVDIHVEERPSGATMGGARRAKRVSIPTPIASPELTEPASRSQSSLLTKVSFPVEVKQQALATYVLEFGLALYSVLVGLALAVSDRSFIVMLVAICVLQFFEGLALGSSLAELYWLKAQILAHRCERSPGPASAESSERSVQVQCTQSTTFQSHVPSNPQFFSSKTTVSSTEPSCAIDARSKSRRTLASMATSFTPEPWRVDPHVELTIGDDMRPHISADFYTSRSASGMPHVAIPVSDAQRVLKPRSVPERIPGWWKAWISALLYTATTPTGIVIGLAIRNIYDPASKYALLFNGVLASICAGVLVYTGLVTLMIGGFNSDRFRALSRPAQVLFFAAAYCGAAVMACLKIWI